MSDLFLEDFIPVYPNPDEPAIQTLLTNKQEFAELATSTSDPPPVPGDRYKYQESSLRFLRAYDTLINISETGTGKSRTFIDFAEYLRDNSNVIKRVVILERSEVLLTEMKRQIEKHSHGRYTTDQVRASTTSSTRKNNVSRAIKSWYELHSFGSFAKRIEGSDKSTRLTDQQIIDYYSGCLFFIDEAHGLTKDGNLNDEVTEADLTVRYNAVLRVLSLVKRAKKIIATATPMINDTTRFSQILNLGLQADRRLLNSYDYKMATLEQLEPYLRGKITFVRNLETGAVPVLQGIRILGPDRQTPYIYETPIPDPSGQASRLTWQTKSQLTIFPSLLSEFQEKWIAAAEERKKSNTIYIGERNASNFVFPDGSSQGEFTKLEAPSSSGPGRYFYQDTNRRYRVRPEHAGWWASLRDLGTPDQPRGLRVHSAKYADLIELSTEVIPDQPLQRRPRKGAGYMYLDLVAGGGTIMLGLCFELFGYEEFRSSESVFVTVGGVRTIRSDFAKKPRYCRLDNTTLVPVRDSMLELFNSKENVHGEYIQTFITAPVGRDGINIFNVVRAHLASPGWHPSGNHQAISRPFRADSHRELLRLKIEELVAGGMSAEEAAQKARVNVDVYYHAVISRTTGTSAELRMYQHAEKKNIAIRRLMRFQKQAAFDYQIHRHLNIRASDVDGSAVCDYDTCDYRGTTAQALPSPKEIDYSTYDLLYADTEVDRLIATILERVRLQGVVSFLRLHRELVQSNQVRERIYLLTIDKLLSRTRELTDRFGFVAYLHSDGNSLFLQRDYPTSSASANLLYYSNVLIGNTKTDFLDLIQEVQPSEDQILEMATQALNVNSTKSQIDDFFRRHTLRTQSYLIEQAMLRDPRLDSIGAALLNRFRRFVFGPIPEPVDELQRAAGGELKLPAGRQAYVHIMYSRPQSNTHFKTNSKLRSVKDQIRLLLLDPTESTEGKWRDAIAYKDEQLIYQRIVQALRDKELASFREQDVYGTLLSDGLLRISRKEVIAQTKDGRDDTRTLTGRICTTFSIPDLLQILARELIYPPALLAHKWANQYPTEQLLAGLATKGITTFNTPPIRTYTDHQLWVLWLWKQASHVTAVELCNILQTGLAASGKIYEE